MPKNPLIEVIFDCLLKTPCWKVHTLANFLIQNNNLKRLDTDCNKDLFKKNFIIMNALFQLSCNLIGSGYILIIEPLEIRLAKINEKKLSKPNKNLKDYYLDWNNFETDSKDIEVLFNSFWQSYLTSKTKESINPKMISDALNYFELPKNATSEQISRQWKKLALKYHPDKVNGDKNKFQQLQVHWQVLKTALN
ncbi:DNA-J related domain-containing protein [Pseudoalteromonas sp. NBT06-2]|uniref:DNA-J related domain-containing protein n=1 Tax=Pseudoalteromonas sp. NBT06-2 TaxID=2025950 RepID=UPI0014821D86|nr:DNA-J related domain-containing protein [Pseudoalteromonas sp. NBT06-2]